MKTLLIVLTLLSTFAMAHEDGKKHSHMNEEKFALFKKRALENIDKRIAQMQKARTCISNASDREAMKSCRADMKEHRQEWKEKRKEWKAKKKEKRAKKED
tara:strand:- start:76795 stop:77097 length:303 start_codon:yes stop_codon:yes gene_type:complete